MTARPGNDNIAGGDVQRGWFPLDAERHRAYWAHMSLRQVDWSIRHHDTEAVDRWLDIAASGPW